MKTLKKILSILVLIFVIVSCKKDPVTAPQSNREPTPYYVRLTDAPALYQAVYVDIQGVEITGNGGANVMLNVNPGIYNLLDFSNGIDTLIATGSLYVDNVQQIRLILGPNNSVVVNNVSYPLKTPSAQQSGLKLQVHQDLQPGVAYYVLLDFDASLSIVEHGNGDYSLKPVIRTIQTALSGSIKGKIVPSGVFATVLATSGPNSYSTIVNANGEFVIAGLPAGTYTIVITPATPYNPITLNNVVVTVGGSTNVGNLNI
ncbi:MAG: DUF4382 domain-containing protein [Bacteroidia bacterium]|nr:DUF4382 domain-containing protein [Bacteroidia bacterium]